MPLLDIATAQPSSQNHLCPLRTQSLTHAKILSSQFISGDDNRLCFASKPFQFTTKTSVNLGLFETQRGKLVITAVATIEPECLIRKEDRAKNALLGLELDAGLQIVQFESPDGESEELDEREKLRRMRISKANKGNTPWNKGRKHSPETLQRIKERTRLAMKNPKVRMKLINLGHAQSEETKKKIGVGVRIGWERRRGKLMVQESCYFEWQNLIAEASRRGLAGEEELQWDSYKIMDEQLKDEWLESIEQRKLMPRVKGSKRAPKSPEQRKKIAAAIAAKWADPEYRERVCAGLSKFHRVPVGVERKPKRKPRDITQSTKQALTKKKDSDADSSKSEPKSRIEKFKMRRSNTPQYKDPSAKSKLEMIKNIRAERVAAESKKTKAIKRARLLIAEAEKAAKALEIAAVKSPIARASLIETLKLIAEATQSLESIETEQITSNDDNGGLPSFVSAESVHQAEKDSEETENGGLDQLIELIRVNGKQALAPIKDEDFNFASFTMSGKLNGQEHLHANSNGYSLQTLNLESLMIQSDSAMQLGHLEPNGTGECDNNPQPNGSEVHSLEAEKPSIQDAVTKKWVCGRLVEVTRGA